MKKIAITQRLLKNSDYYEIRDALDLRWGDLFKKLEYLPILLPTNYDFEKYFEAMEISGIILSGGNDLGCITKSDLSIKRDNFENSIIKFAIKENIPILGVCRGMQIIANYFNAEFEKIEGHVGTMHKIIVSMESTFRGDLKKLEIVNSYHNYGIKKLPNSFKVSARSEDGKIEAMENDDCTIFCHMWHPERRVPFNDDELMMIKNFFI